MTARPRPLRRAAAAIAVSTMVLAACGGSADGPGSEQGGESVDGEDATRSLEQQRDDVRSDLQDLLREAGAALGATGSPGGSGQYVGCESSGPETFRDFRYRATGRIDAGPRAARPYLDLLTEAFAQVGFADVVEGERPGGRTLSGAHDGIEAAFSELPDQGDYVLLSVSGPCVDVPEDASADWLARGDEEIPAR